MPIMKNSIIFAILMCLLGKAKVTRGYLAKRFEISKSTVGRYINVLADSGVPVYGVSGPEGGYSIDEDYRLAHSFLLPEEKRRIVASLEAAKEYYADGLNDIVIDKINNISQSKKKRGGNGSAAVRLELEFESKALPRVKEWLGGDGISRSGMCYFAAGEVTDADIVGSLLSLGGSVKVVSPPFIRDALIAECENIAARYE